MITVTTKDHNYNGTLRGKGLTFSYNGTSGFFFLTVHLSIILEINQLKEKILVL